MKYREHLVNVSGDITEYIKVLEDLVRNSLDKSFSKDTIRRYADQLNYYDIVQSTDKVSDMRYMLHDRVQEHLRLLNMDEKEMDEYILSKGMIIPNKIGIHGKVVYILSGGHTIDEIKELKEVKEKKTQKRIERKEEKWEKNENFEEQLPIIQDQYKRDMQLSGLSKNKVLATIVALIDETLMRIGGEAYAEKHGTYGASSIRGKHVTIGDGSVTFDFVGKKGMEQHKEIDDIQLMKVLKELYKNLSGPEDNFFKYKETDGSLVKVTDGDVRKYLLSIVPDVSPHMFRYYYGTKIVLEGMGSGLSYDDAVGEASKELGHFRTNKNGEIVPDTGNTAQKSYIDPNVIDMYCCGRGERNPVYINAITEANKEKDGEDVQDRQTLIRYLRSHSKSKAWIKFRGN